MHQCTGTVRGGGGAANIYVSMYVCIYMYVCKWTHTHTHTHIHTHIHTPKIHTNTHNTCSGRGGGRIADSCKHMRQKTKSGSGRGAEDSLIQSHALDSWVKLACAFNSFPQITKTLKTHIIQVLDVAEEALRDSCKRMRLDVQFLRKSRNCWCRSTI